MRGSVGVRRGCPLDPPLVGRPSSTPRALRSVDASAPAMAALTSSFAGLRLGEQQATPLRCSSRAAAAARPAFLVQAATTQEKRVRRHFILRKKARAPPNTTNTLPSRPHKLPRSPPRSAAPAPARPAVQQPHKACRRMSS